MPLRVGFLTERMILGFGVDLVVDQTARRLARSGCEVSVYTTRSELDPGSVPYRIVVLPDQLGCHDPDSLSFQAAALRLLRQEPIDVWVPQTPPFYSWSAQLPAPVVCVEHGTPPGHFFPARFGRFLDAATERRFRHTYARLRPADGLVAISASIREALPEAVRPRCVVIPNGGDHYPAASAAEAAQLRGSLGVAPGQPLLAWVGRIEPERDHQPYKGFGAFLRLSEALQRRHPQLAVVVVGRGRESAAAFLRQRGLLPLLNLPAERMPALLAAADLFVSTSRWEGFNLPLVEAQAQGTPVVAYHLCAHPEVVAEGISGLLVPCPGPGPDPAASDATAEAALLEAVSGLLEDPGRLAALAEGARAQAARFRWDATAAQLLQLLEACRAEALANPAAAQPEPLPRPPSRLRDLAHRLRRWHALGGRRTVLRECARSLLRALGLI